MKYYMINHNKNEDENEKRSHRYDINRPRSRHGHKYGKYKMSRHENAYMYQATPKQHFTVDS